MRKNNYWLRLFLVFATGGSLLGIGDCTLSGAANFARNFNPCGTIIDCTAIGGPAGYRFLTSGYKGPGVNPDINPACTHPPYCVNDPFAPFGGGG